MELNLLVFSYSRLMLAYSGYNALFETEFDIEPLTIQGVQLGRMLFYEKRMSGDNSMSCASCHRQEHAFSDTAKFSIGIYGDPSHRQAMSAVNMLWNSNGFRTSREANPSSEMDDLSLRCTPISFYVHLVSLAQPLKCLMH